MINIKDLQHFEIETQDEKSYCLLFGRDKSPTCRVMKTVLSEVSRKRDYKSVYLDISVQKFYKIVKQHNVSIIPKFVFINNGNVVLEGVGTRSKRWIEKRLREQEA